MNEIARRSVLLGGGVLLLGACGGAQRSEGHASGGGPHEEQDVSPTEDLMQEHGLLDRTLLIYEEALRRLAAGHELPASVLHQTASIVQQFMHQYHEVNEEQHIFPHGETNPELRPLVATLRMQHEHGRAVTARILAASTDASWADPAQRTEAAHALESFVRMYRPHAAREDTVLFPAVRDMFRPHDWHELGEQFETDEHRRFGAPGFEGMVERVAGIERTLGIYELAQFTPA